MKILLTITLVLLFISKQSQAQWTTTGAITSTNNSVGIGTTSPSAPLDVNGNINSSSYLSSTLGYYMNVTLSGINNAAGYGYLSFRSNNMDNRMVIDPNGNVGVGTTDTMGYKFAVNGAAVATSITVKSNTNWPDYVFKPTYNLSTLPELKTYVDKNH